MKEKKVAFKILGKLKMGMAGLSEALLQKHFAELKKFDEEPCKTCECKWICERFQMAFCG